VPRIVPLPDKRRVGSGPGRSASLDLDKAWHLYDRQARFVTSDALFNLFLGGVGSGKTVGGTAWGLRKALVNPGSVGAVLGRTGVDLDTILLPSLFKQLDEAQEQSGVCWISDYDKGKARLKLINNSYIYFRPYNRIAKLRGLSLTWAYADEIEWSEANPDEIWSVLTGRLRGRGPYPGLGFSTSPNGLRGIVKKFVEAQRKYLDAVKRGDAAGMAEWGKYYVVTANSFCNPFLPPPFFESLRAMSKRRYEQEVEGKVLRPLNTVWAVETRHMVDWDWRAHPNLPRVYGVDWGTQNHHYACMSQVEPTGRWVVCDELVRDGIPRGQFEQVLYNWIDSHGSAPPAHFGVDRACPTENNHLAARYRHSHVGWMESKEEKDVTQGIEMVRDALDPVSGNPLIVFSTSLAQTYTGDTANMLPAMRGYVYYLDLDGQPTTKPKKDNVHDHAADALRYHWRATADRIDLHGGRTLWVPSAGEHKPPVGHGNSSSQAV
jgi:hypothetical protein